MSELPLSIKADAKQFMLQAKGIKGAEGRIVGSLELRDASGQLVLKIPAKLFPFLKEDVACVTLSIVQITLDQPSQPAIEQPGLILPGRN